MHIWKIDGLMWCFLFGSFFLHLQNFFYTFKLSLNYLKTLWSFKEICRHHTLKIMSTSESQNIWFSEVKIYHRKSTFGSQNVSPKVDFRKSKYITGSRLPEVKNYHRKSTSGSQKIFSEVDFQKSKNIPGTWLPEVKRNSPEVHLRK